MHNKVLLLLVILLSNSLSVYSFGINSGDLRKKEAKHIHKVLKEEEKEKYKRKSFDYEPSGFMTKDAYEALSGYRDKSNDKIDIPKVNQSDMKYVPQPTYKIVRYNDPPGSPELSINKNIYKLHQYNGQGITSPDYSIMVYPVVYYYPDSETTATDLFVIPLVENGTNLEKILKANAKKRLPDPILSTEKSIDNDTAFRTLTPIDFSADGTKLLVKEKIGSSRDGIWKTNAIVYDFGTKTSYNLVELRDSIIYYWKENYNLDLDECRWDIYPLGFLKDSNSRIAAYGYAYTGKKPVFLGLWSIDSKGEQSRLLTFDISQVEISVNGFKVVQDGVVKPTIVQSEEKALKKKEKADMKAAKKNSKLVKKQFKEEYKAKIKEMDQEFKEKTRDYNKIQRIKGSTTANDIPVKFREQKIDELEKTINKQERIIEKQQKYIDKIDEKLNKYNTTKESL